MAARRKASTASRIKTAEKERDALELRKGGATFEQIAREVGYSDGSGAAKAVSRALADTIQEPAADLRRLELERLDSLLAALWPKAIDGDAQAVDRCLRVMERRASLLGLDAPSRRIVDFITHDAFSRAMQELEAEIAEYETAGDRGQPD